RKTAESEHADERVFMNLGRLELALEHFDEGLAAFGEALKLDPEIVEAHLRVGELLCQNGEQATGVLHFERIIEMQPEDLNLRLMATLAHTQLGDLDAAEQHAQAARDSFPSQPEPLFALSQIAQARGDLGQAERLFEEGQALNQSIPQPQDSDE
ncbi:MAG: tetratricopeptide (TPR) repeat protein, partial [Candidatus Paceibacteria bacterium]